MEYIYIAFDMSSAATASTAYSNVRALSSTPAMMRFEIATLTEFNRYLSVEQDQDDHFTTYDELKDIHDNTGTTRKYLTGIAEHIMMEYLNELTENEMSELAFELGLEDFQTKPVSKYTQIKCGLYDKFIESPSAKQLIMMKM